MLSYPILVITNCYKFEKCKKKKKSSVNVKLTNVLFYFDGEEFMQFV